MAERLLLARIFFVGGIALIIIGLILRGSLPVATSYPPFLVTAVLMLGYGLFCMKQSPDVAGQKKTGA